MAQRDEVDEVVGVEMADDDRRQQAWLQRGRQIREGALAQIEQQGGAG